MPAIGSFENAPERVRHGADEPAVDVDRTAAHPGDDAGGRQRSAFEPRQNQIPVRADDVFDDAKNLHREFVDAGAFEHCAADAHHAGANLGHAHLRRGRADDREGKRRDTQQEGEPQ